MSLRELARQSKLSPSFLSGLERGTRTALPSDASIKRLANALGADADELTLKCGRLPAEVARWLVEDPARVRAVRAQMKPGAQNFRAIGYFPGAGV